MLTIILSKLYSCADRRSTIQSHKNTVLCCDWSANGNWFATGSRDFQLKVFDVRNCGREVCSFQGHNREVRSQRN